MPTKIRYIGKSIDYRGKKIFDILTNLKDFGVGRVLTRGLEEVHPEKSSYKIVKVEPQMDKVKS